MRKQRTMSCHQRGTKKNKPTPIFMVGVSHIHEEEVFYKIQNSLAEILYDYHVLLYVDNKLEENDMTFNVFYEKDFSKVKYEQLKALVAKTIQNAA